VELERNDQRRVGLRLPKRVRLATPRAFRAVYEAQVRKSSGPLLVFGKPNALQYTRIGLSVGRRVGTAVVRNRVKRQLREAFRHVRQGAPRGYDFVINVREHERARRDEYEQWLMKAFLQVDRIWRTRKEKTGEKNGSA
jgi:ribonuclease P protein component